MGSKKYVDFDKVITTYKTFGHLNLPNILEAFNEIPAADVRPVVRGKWEDCTEYNGEYRCPICKEFEGHKRNFCPNCGADMRGTNE